MIPADADHAVDDNEKNGSLFTVGLIATTDVDCWNIGSGVSQHMTATHDLLLEMAVL